MKTTKPIERRYTENVIDKVTCDCCGKANPNSDEIDWAEGHYEVDDIEITRITGTDYPGDRETETQRFHVCPPCWEEKLVPFLQALRPKPTVVIEG